MKFRQLGKTGLVVSRVCLGTMTFGMSNWGCDRETAMAMTHQFLDGGGNFIDTADVYSKGVSEEIVGEALKSRKRDDVVLATKGFQRMGTAPTAIGLSRKHIIEACEASLRRLQTDYIDLYQIHGPDPRTPYEETLRTLDDLVRQGKVRYIGCSNLFAWQIVKANGISMQLNLEKLSCAQHMYNLIIRDVEREILPACADQGMGFICWSPLASGMLSGKYQKADQPQEGTRIGYRAQLDVPRFWHEKGFKIAETVTAIANETGKTASQVALAWLLGDKRVTSVIIGVRKPEQVTDNLVVGDWNLPDEMKKRLDLVAEFDLGYPDSWISKVYEGNFRDVE